MRGDVEIKGLKGESIIRSLDCMGLGEAKGELADRNRFGVLLRVDSLESMPGVPNRGLNSSSIAESFELYERLSRALGVDILDN